MCVCAKQGHALIQDCSEGGEEEGEGEGEGGAVDPEFRAAVRRALGPAALNSDSEVGRLPAPRARVGREVSRCCQAGSEGSLDDDAMMAVDEALAAAFRTRTAGRQHRMQQQGFPSSSPPLPSHARSPLR